MASKCDETSEKVATSVSGLRDELKNYEKQLAELECSTVTKEGSTAVLMEKVVKLKEKVEPKPVRFESMKNDLHEINKKLSAMYHDDATPKTGAKTRQEYEEMKRMLDEFEGSKSRGMSTNDRISECRAKIDLIENREKEINRIFQLMISSQAVDLCFLIDCTGSMASYIEEVKQKIQMIVDRSKSAFPHLKLAVSFVGYRDHCDNNDRTIVLLFTESIPEFQNFVSKIKATGGGDIPEDIFGGLEEVTKLNWTKKTRILFHIGDAPCHGTRFHELGAAADNYSDGDPRGLSIDDLLFKVQQLKIIYWFAKLNDTTDKMIKEFENVMGGPRKINQIALTSVEDLVDAVEGSISVSISLEEKSVMDKACHDEIRGDAGSILKSYMLDPREPDWKSVTTENVTVWESKFPSDLKTIKKSPELVRSEHRVKKAPNPFAQGELRIAYYGIDNTFERMNEIVLKEFKHVGEKQNKLERHKEQLEIQSIAVALALKFNQVKPEGARDVHFTKVSIVSFTRQGKNSYFTQERRIHGNYVKFNNNFGFVNKDAYTATLNAFSHWTYYSTRNYLMVVDLQGVKEETTDETKYVLTDPAIHCGRLDRFGNTNLGREGMYRFFHTHYCNSICRAMGLRRHRFQPEGSKDFSGATAVAERP